MDWSELKSASISGLGINLGAQVLRFLLQFAYQVTLAHLLAPKDFGLVALSAPIIAFVQLFADLGLSQATIQKTSISDDQINLMFWVNVSAGIALALLTLVASPIVGWFYGDPRVVGVTMASGALFVIGGFYTQHLALLNRNMRFQLLALTDVGGILVGAAAGVAAAAFRLGYWSIVIGQAATSVTTLLIAWSTVRWRPRRPGRTAEARALLSFGANLTGFNFANYFARNLDNVLIGRFCGEQSLGFYDRAYKLLLLPISQISTPLSRLAIPLLSKCNTEPARYRSAYLRLLEVTLLLTYPGVTFAIVFSKPLIGFVLGSRWADVAPIFSVLGVGAFVAAIGNTTGWLFISQGRARDLRNIGLVLSAVYVTSFVVGLPWGPQGVATCYVLTTLAALPLLLRAATEVGPVTFRDIWNSLRPFLIAGVATGAALTWIRRAGGGSPMLAIAALCSYLFYSIGLWGSARGREMLRELSGHLKGYAGRLPIGARGG